MLRFVFISIILIHGLIHLMSFTKAFGLAEIPQLTLPISKPAGLFWLGAALLFFATAIDFYLKWEWWWVLALSGAVISQILVILYWQEAKFGTIANIIILGGAVLAYGSWSFNAMVKNELESFIPSQLESQIVTEEDVSTLPLPVRRWMESSNTIEKEMINTVRFEQGGKMKTEPGGKWLPVEARQFVRTKEPGFLWIADVKAAPYVHLSGRDMYINGKGEMLIKVLSLIPIVDSKGPEINQGALLRYLAEMVWYPSVALRDYISWELQDSISAKATMSYGEVTASGTFTFNKKGLVKSFETERYYNRKEGATLETWLITIDENSYRTFNGISVPTRAEVTWKLEQGDFTWYKLDISNYVTGF